MDANGSNAQRLTNNNKGDGQPSWSPDGTKIAFTTQRDGEALVYVMNANGSNQVNITQSTTLDSADPEWSPDGTTIAFTSYKRVGQTNADEIFLMNADGSNIRRITNASFDEHDLAWQPLGQAPPPTPTPTPTPTPSPTPAFTVSGTVTEGSTGAPLPGVTMVLFGDVTGTQIAFTDQNGNYVINFPEGGSHSLTVSASKANYIFTPLAETFVFPSESKTRSFVGTQSPVPVTFAQIPVLLTQQNSLRSAALDSVTLVSEPFGITNIHNFSTDQRGRVSLFAASIDLWPNEPVSVITAQAEDSLGNIFPLTIEAFSAVPNFPWLKQIVVKLPDEIADKVEVRVSIKARDASSNKVIVKVKP
jgi:TolB protein